ncbi:MAG: beta-galactosidase, partial [Clostridia bacterium]|nr:beta-galactosidase [Clostridia bacterium]
EHGNWGLDLSLPTCWAGFLPEWLEILRRDYNHPAIIGWCPLNETWNKQDKQFVEMLYDMTKAYDPYRMFIDCSGWFHVKTEIMDEHNGDPDPVHFREYYAPLEEGKEPSEKHWYTGVQAPASTTFISEYGGIALALDEGAWSYGTVPKNEEEFLTRLKGLTDVLLDNKGISACCYIQLTDVEQEQNGLYYYDRRPKLDPALIYPIFSRKAAIED